MISSVIMSALVEVALAVETASSSISSQLLLLPTPGLYLDVIRTAAGTVGLACKIRTRRIVYARFGLVVNGAKPACGISVHRRYYEHTLTLPAYLTWYRFVNIRRRDIFWLYTF